MTARRAAVRIVVYMATGALSERSLHPAVKIAVVLLFLFLATLSGPTLAARPVLSNAQASEQNGTTQFALWLNAPVHYRVFTLDRPPRVVIDLPHIDWLPSGEPRISGPCPSLRHGRFTPEASRVVIECREAMTVRSSALITGESGGHRLLLDLVPASLPTNADASEEQARQATRERQRRAGPFTGPKIGGVAMAPVVGATGLAVGDVGLPSESASAVSPDGAKFAANPLRPGPPRPRPATSAVPLPQWVVAIDAGHGGQDPGALSLSGYQEKRITLAAALALREELKALKRYKVILTRKGDRFVRLRDRIAIARAAGADIFVSLHADTMPSDVVRGLSVYTLSERASDAEAAALAERENKVDRIGGIKLVGETLEVTNILIDLIQRETMNDSARFASLIVNQLRSETTLLPRTHRFAGFAVLKAPDIPSVLIELGYLSNETEERLLQSGSYRQKLARGIAHAIDRYFVTVEAQNRH